MELYNLTNHVVRLASGGSTVHVPYEDRTSPWLDVQHYTEASVTIDGLDIPVQRSVVASARGIPDEQPGVLYLVPSIVQKFLPHRDDIVTVGNLTRDDNGKVAFGRALMRPPAPYQGNVRG